MNLGSISAATTENEMNEKQEILSAAERRDLVQKLTFYENLRFPVAVSLIAKLRAQLAADDLARLQMEATTRQ